MIMVLTGAGGTGKSALIAAITKLAHLTYGKTEGSWGCILKTAPTGCAAFNIRGSTWQSALGKTSLARLTLKAPLAAAQAVGLQRKAKGLKLFVLDEMSLSSLEDVYEIDRRLRAAMEVDKPFGGLHVILAGDFYQMKAMGGTPIVQSHIPVTNLEATQARRMMTDSVTDYVELVVNCRAMSNNGILSPLAKFCSVARVGEPTVRMLAEINQKVVNNVRQAMQKAHSNAVWITSTHKKVGEINQCYSKVMVEKGGVVRRIVADHLTSDKEPKPTTDIRRALYGKAGDPKGARNTLMMTHLDLLEGTRVRLIRNLSVENGLYNGAMGTIRGFMYKGNGPQTATDYMPTNFSTLTEEQREIPIVLVQMDGDDDSIASCSTTIPRLVPFGGFAGTAIDHKYHRVQLPFLPAHARTGHSVQGMTAHDGVVVDCGSSFFAGDYVAISRATDMDKVILLSPSLPQYWNIHPDYRLMVQKEYERLRAQFAKT